MQSLELRKPVANIKGGLILLEMDGYFKTYLGPIELQYAIDKLDNSIVEIVNSTDIN